MFTDVAVDPSGKLALTIGKDRKLITWNLIKGRSAYVTNIKEIADFVKWAPDGQRFIVGFYKHVDVYSTSNASVEFSVNLKGRANSVEFLDENTFALCGDMPQIEVYSLLTKEQVYKFDAHETRVRCMSFLAPNCLVTGSNDGLIKVWNFQDLKADLITSMDTKCRITSMVVHKTPKAQTVPEIKPELVEALAKETKQKRSIGFVEDIEPTSKENDDQPKLVVEVEAEEPVKKKGKRNKKKNKNVNDVS